MGLVAHSFSHYHHQLAQGEDSDFTQATFEFYICMDQTLVGSDTKAEAIFVKSELS